MKTSISLSLVCACALFFIGCGTIVNGTYQKIGVSSNPTGANVEIDGISVGKTPVILDLKRKDDHNVRLTMDGYAPFDMPIVCKVSGWVWGNIFFFGLIGLGVDAVTGGMYKLTPEQIRAEMRKDGTGAIMEEDGIYVTVVMTPDPNWEKIGQLQPAR